MAVENKNIVINEEEATELIGNEIWEDFRGKQLILDLIPQGCPGNTTIIFDKNGLIPALSETHPSCSRPDRTNDVCDYCQFNPDGDKLSYPK
jgi:hypothetical protein